MWVATNRRVARENGVVLVFGTEVDFYSNEVLVPQLDQFRVGLKELIQCVAPTTPLAAHFEQNVFVRALRLFDGFAYVLSGIAPGIVFRYGNIFGPVR